MVCSSCHHTAQLVSRPDYAKNSLGMRLFTFTYWYYYLCFLYVCTSILFPPTFVITVVLAYLVSHGQTLRGHARLLLTCSRSNCTRPSMAMTLLTLFPYAFDSNVLSFMVVWEWYTRPRKGKRVTLGGKGEHHRYVYMHSSIVSVAQHCSTKREGSGDLSRTLEQT